MWEIGLLDWEDEYPLRLEFLIKFHTESHSPELYKYYICLQRLKVHTIPVFYFLKNDKHCIVYGLYDFDTL